MGETRTGSLNRLMLQECALLNALVQHIKLTLLDLDLRASNEEMPETKEMLQTLQSLQQGVVPAVWLGPTSSTNIDLASWLSHIVGARNMLDDWITDSERLDAVRLAYMSNP